MMFLRTTKAATARIAAAKPAAGPAPRAAGPGTVRGPCPATPPATNSPVRPQGRRRGQREVGGHAGGADQGDDHQRGRDGAVDAHAGEQDQRRHDHEPAADAEQPGEDAGTEADEREHRGACARSSAAARSGRAGTTPRLGGSGRSPARTAVASLGFRPAWRHIRTATSPSGRRRAAGAPLGELPAGQEPAGAPTSRRRRRAAPCPPRPPPAEPWKKPTRAVVLTAASETPIASRGAEAPGRRRAAARRRSSPRPPSGPGRA